MTGVSIEVIVAGLGQPYGLALHSANRQIRDRPPSIVVLGRTMTRLKIYGIAASRAFRVLWCTEELGLDYESIPIHFSGTFTLWESMAITCYRARKHDRLWPRTVEGERLAPARSAATEPASSPRPGC
jgi:hypothetical protein